MSDFDKIGISNQGLFNPAIRISKKSEDFGQGEDAKQKALKSATETTGSELVYQTGDGNWQVAEIKEDGFLWNPATSLSEDNKDKIKLDETLLAVKDIAQSVISFVEDDEHFDVEKLATDPDKDVRMVLARRNDLPADVYMTLAKDNENIKAILAKNPNLPPEVLKVLVEDKSDAVKKILASNPSACANSEIRNRLLSDDNKEVRMLLAKNIPNTASTNPVIPDSVEALDRPERIGVDHKGYLGLGLIDRPVEMYKKIGDFGQGDAGKQKAMQAASEEPGSELVYQTDDGNWHVSEVKEKGFLFIDDSDLSVKDKKTVEVSETDKMKLGVKEAFVSFVEEDQNYAFNKLATDKDKDVQMVLARRNDLPLETYMTMAKKGDDEIREILAKKTEIPVDVLKVLAKDPKPEIRQMVAKNPQAYADADIRSILVKDKDKAVRMIMAQGGPKKPEQPANTTGTQGTTGVNTANTNVNAPNNNIVINNNIEVKIVNENGEIKSITVDTKK